MELFTSNTIFRDFWMITHAAACGSTLGELDHVDLDEDFKDVEIRDHACGDVIEIILL